MFWSFGIPVGLLVALCGTILFYTSKKYRKLAYYLITGGVGLSLLTSLVIFLFWV